MADANITFDTKFNAAGFNKGMKDINKQLANTNKAISGMANNTKISTSSMGKSIMGLSNPIKAITKLLAMIGFGKLVKDSTKMAMGVESAMDNINYTMKNSTTIFNEWVKNTSQSFGIARADAYKYGSVYSNLLSVFTKSAEETTNETKKLMEATAVIASKTGRSFDDTANRIRSGMLGSTEAIEDLGIYTQVSMLESTKAFKEFAGDKSWSQLSFQVQQQIRLAAILEQAYERYGDTLADTTQTRHSSFIASLSNMKLSLGQAFLPIYDVILPALTKVADAITIVLEKFALFTATLFGRSDKVNNPFAGQEESIDKSVSGMEDLGKETDKMNKKAKKAANTLQGFDQLNIQKTRDDDVDALGSSSGLSGLDKGIKSSTGEVTTLEEGTKKLSDTIEKFYNEWGAKDIVDGIKRGLEKVNFDNMKNNLGIIASDWKEIGFVALDSLKSISKAMGGLIGVSLEHTIAIIGNLIDILIEGFAKFTSGSKDKIKEWMKSITDTVTDTINKWADSVDILGEILLISIDKFRDKLVNIVSDTFTNMSDTYMFIGTVITDTLNIASTGINNFIINNKDKIQTFVDGIFGIFTDMADGINMVWSDLLGSLNNFWETWAKDWIDSLVDVIMSGVGWIIDIFNDGILPVWKEFVNNFKETWTENIKPMVDSILEFVGKLMEASTLFWDKFAKPIIDVLVAFLIPIIKDQLSMVVSIVGNAIRNIADTIKIIFDVLGGIIDFIIGVFTGDWSRAWEGIKDIFGGIMDAMVQIFKTPINLIISMFNGLIESIYSAVNLVSKALNSLSFDIPDWVPKIGGEKFGFDIPKIAAPQIPMLAKGGLIPPRKPRQVIVGDNMSEDEIVSPVSTMKEAFRDVLGELGGLGGNDEIIMLLRELISVTREEMKIEMDQREFGRAVKAVSNNYKGQTGQMQL